MSGPLSETEAVGREHGSQQRLHRPPLPFELGVRLLLRTLVAGLEGASQRVDVPVLDETLTRHGFARNLRQQVASVRERERSAGDAKFTRGVDALCSVHGSM